MAASFWPLIAVVRHTRSPQTTGLDKPRPGRAVFQATLLPLATFQVVAVGLPSATPPAAIPRNCGQSIAGLGARSGAAAGAPRAAPGAQSGRDSSASATLRPEDLSIIVIVPSGPP